jgi:acyl carrier protein
MYLSDNDVIKCVSRALEINIKKININSSYKNLEKWDSLGHLNILTELDKSLKGKAFKLGALAKAYSIKEIIKVLKSHKLLK